MESLGTTAKSTGASHSIIEGVLERIVFFNKSNNFTVARLKVEDRMEPVTIVGTLTSPILGEILRLRGEWVIDARFGEQFRVESCLSVLPCTIAGIEKYLGSGLIRGIGPVMAKRLVSRFGLKTLDIIDKFPERLGEVEGIGPMRTQQIAQSWRQQKDVREVMIFLEGRGISPTFAAKIFQAYGNRSLSVLEKNPYQLAMDITGIGFITADKIAREMGISAASQTRVEAGIIHSLQEQADAGHTCYPLDALKKKVIALLRMNEPDLESALSSLSSQGRVVVQGKEKAQVYLTPLYQAEVNVAEGLKTLIRNRRKPLNIDFTQALVRVQELTGITLAEMQKEALRKALEEKVLIITGGPGTGKTTLMNSLIRILEGKRQKILLASPTGRSAKRLGEVTGRPASTIHRLLEYNPEEGRFTHNSFDPLEADLVIIDEISMIDILLMSSLLEAMTPDTALVMIGDMDQLPSVGPGNVLRDMIESGTIEKVKLDKIFRQAQQSLIIVNAHRINEGKFPITRVLQGPKSDFYFIERTSPPKVVDVIKELCFQRLPAEFDFNPVADVQVLSPMYRGIIGVDNLNSELQKLLNPEEQSILHQGRLFRLHDKVMQIRNDYDKETFNGDTGWIQQIDFEEQRLLVNFDERVVSYSFEEMDELVLAYATSIHKSQGSEYPAVIVPILPQHYIMLQRNLLYTAVTRAKQMMILIGSKQAIAIAIRNNKVQQRYSGLADRLLE